MIKKVNTKEWKTRFKIKTVTTFKKLMDLIVMEKQRSTNEITLKRGCHKDWLNSKFIALAIRHINA